MIYKKYSLIIISATMLNLALMFPSMLYWFVFLYLVPLFYLFETDCLNSIDGFLWSLFLLNTFLLFV